MFGAAAARGICAVLRRRPPARPPAALVLRTNHRGQQVSVAGGPACALAAAVGAAATPGLAGRVRLALAVAAAGAGGLGSYDDLVGSRASRGLAGHVGALGRGEVTSGSVKLLGLAATGVAAAAALPPCSRGPGRVTDVAATGAAVAGSANLVNLFDLRPGRALKVALLTGAPLLAGGRQHRGAPVAAPLGAALALLPDDLGERAMLGDSGANALGAVLGVGAASGLGRGGRFALLGATCGLTAASEVVSFTRVIDAVRPLRWFDRLGRPAPEV